MDELVNIGALSRLTGIPTDTLRTWERRYGFPLPERTQAGHRRYGLHTCERLLRIRRLLENGYRPSTVLRWSESEVQRALEITTGKDKIESKLAVRASSHELRAWIEYAQRFSGEDLDRSFERAWTRMSAIDFLEGWAGPFLVALGEGWAAKQLEVQHEHYASVRLQQFLEGKWRPLADIAVGPMVACATLRGEEHSLGLQLVASALVLAECRILYLGSNVPVGNMVRACQQQSVDGLALSVSAWSRDLNVVAQLKQLRSEIMGLPIVVGGAGAPLSCEGMECTRSLRQLQHWVSCLNGERPDRLGSEIEKG